MCHPSRNRFNRIAIAASGIALMLGGSALAQTVQVFDDAPTLEQLRSIMIPESQPTIGRTIVIQRPDTGASSSVQRVATQAMPAARTSLPAANVTAPEVEPVSVSVPAPARTQVSRTSADAKPAAGAKPSAEAKPGAVGMRINFGFNSAVLPDSAHAMIDVVAQVMKESPDIKVRVEGHTDAIGAADYNAALSERRALSVGEYLVKMGVDPSRLELIGKGMAEPLTRNPYDPNNRRVQFVRMG
jgi:outer membrane protein OmpA-like peptidoglycan-associated protein